MEKLNYILLFIAASVFVLLIWNIITGKKITNKIEKTEELSDSKYWELKFKSQYMISIFTVMMALLAYLGYNSIDKIEQETKDYLATSQDSVRILSDSIKAVSKKISEYNYKADTIKSNSDNVYRNLKSYQNATVNLKGQVVKIKEIIDSVSANNKVKQNFYVVDSLYQLSNAQTGKKYYYADLVTSIGDHLPKFHRTPVVVPLTRGACDIFAEAKNNEFFTASYGPFCSEDIDYKNPIKLYFSILIIETP